MGNRSFVLGGLFVLEHIVATIKIITAIQKIWTCLTSNLLYKKLTKKKEQIKYHNQIS